MEYEERSVVRLCTTTVTGLFEIVDYDIKWADGQIRDEFPKFKGSFSFLADTTLSELFKSFKTNISVNVEKENGIRKRDGTLTGCYRSIRDNESDISTLWVDYPTIDYDKVDPYQVLVEHPLKIMSGYHSKAEADYSFNDFILTSIKSFDNQTWFTVLVMVSAFFGLWMIKRALFPDGEDVSLRKTIAETLWDTLLLFISQESTDYDRFLDRFLSILMTVSFFFLTNIYFGLMSTDLVSVAKPAVINSYQDIMNRPNITPVFFETLSDTQEFEDAFRDNDDSIQAKFWAKYKDEVEMAGPNSDPAKMNEMMQEKEALKKVLIMSGSAIDGFRRVTCILKVGYKLHKNVYTWIAKDSHAKMQAKGMIMRNGMKHTRQLKMFRRKITSAFEGGIFNAVIDAVVKNRLQSSNEIPMPEAPYLQVEKCVSDQVVYADASVDTVLMQNYYLLFAVAVVMLPASITILLIELFCKRYNV